MDADRWDQVKAAFNAALDEAPDDRAALLDRLSLAPEVRVEVDALLAAHDAAPDFLEAVPAAGPGGAPTGAERDEFIGQLVGPYRVVEPVGAGGMGVVYRAVRADATFEMQVALKIVKRGMDTDDVLRRFRDERQTLARLEHPNIAKLLDGGSTANGRPYLVMEFVAGRRVDAYCDDGRLPIAQRLALFETVCRAVQHAHQNLVIHRDLKPDNILVTDDGVPKLVDFGIARVLGAGDAGQDVTRLVERRMTLAYASPEQVRGEPMSTASDVYSLGVVLYELLTGRRPYAQALLTPIAYEKAIADGPRVPSARAGEHDTRPAGDTPALAQPADVAAARRTTAAALRKQLSGDLDTIILKAIDPDPARRYASADQLADDISRHRRGLPVVAQPDTVRYRAAKFIGRHRAGVAAAVLVAAAVVAGVTGTLWQARVARQQRDRAQLEARRARQISDFMAGVLRSADPEQQGRNVTVADALSGAAARAETELADQPEELATIRVTIGATYLQLGQIDTAIELLEKGLALRRRISGPSDELVEAISQLGGAYEERGDLDRAESLHREALAVAERLHGPDDALVISRMRSVASVLMRRGDLANAETMDRDIVGRLRRLTAARAVDEAELAEGLNNLAVVRGNQDRWDDAVNLQREALAIITRLRGPHHPEVAAATSNFATSLEASKQYAEAEANFRQALALRVELLGDDHPSTAWTRYAFASMLTDLGRAAEASPLIAEVLARRGTALADTHPLVAAALQIRGRLEMMGGDLHAAERDFRESLKLRQAALGPDHWLVASSKGFVGDCLTAEGRYPEALQVLTDSVAGLTKAVGPSDSRTVAARARLDALSRKMKSRG